MLNGAKVGGALTLLCTMPTILCHSDSLENKLALPVISSFSASISGAMLGGVFAAIKSKKFDWSPETAGVITGTAAAMTAWIICYLDKVRMF